MPSHYNLKTLHGQITHLGKPRLFAFNTQKKHVHRRILHLNQVHATDEQDGRNTIKSLTTLVCLLPQPSFQYVPDKENYS